MSCIVGVEYDGGVVVGSDSFVGTDELRDLSDGPKWIKHGKNLLIAFAGHLRPAQIVASIGRFRAKNAKESDQIYLQSVVAERIRIAHDKAAISRKDTDFSFLLAFNGKLYTLEEDYAVSRSAFGYMALGGGQFFALGALAGLETLKTSLPARTRVEVALKAATRHSTSVAEPYYFETIEAA